MAELNLRSLTRQEREAHPNAIFMAETASPTDLALMAASFQAMQDAGYPIVFDFEKQRLSPVTKITIRTDNTERKELRAFSALYQGLQEATSLRSDVVPPPTREDVDQYYQAAYETSSQLLADFLSQPPVVEQFNEYYAGLRWGTDQEKIVRTLFEFGADYDEQTVEENMSSSVLTSIAYALDIPYEKRSKWYDQKPEKILKQNPDIDYRRLRDPEFAQSEQGQLLASAYARATGNEIARQFQNSEARVTSTGESRTRPNIPLSRFPIIEALICSEMQVDGPRAKYSFGPSDLFDIIPYTDSVFAHEAMTHLITTRLPRERRPGMMHDGQDEFDHKASAIWPILRAYREYENDDEKRQQIIEDLLVIAEAYDVDGSIAASVRDEYQESVRRSPKYPDNRDSHSVRTIVSNLLTTMLASSDTEVFGKASQMISLSLEASKALTQEVDPTILSRSDLMIICIDTLKYVTDNMQTSAFGRNASAVFESTEAGKQLQRFAEMQQRIGELQNQPNVREAWMELRKHSFHLGDEDPAYTQARANYDAELQPATLLGEQLRTERNQFLLELLTTSLDSGDGSVMSAFREIVGRIEISDYHMTVIPNEYYALTDLAQHPNITADQRNTILWHIAEQWKHLDGNSAHLLVPVVLEFYQIVLGDPENMVIPDRNTSHGLSAASHLVYENRGLFKSASPEQLQELAKYAAGMQRIAKMVAGNEFLTDGNQMHDIMIAEQTDEVNDPYKWQKEKLREIQYCSDEIARVAEHYQQYLRIEAIKVQPNLFYPWMLEQLVPFWQKIQWEVSDGNRPSSMMRRLYEFLHNSIKNRLVINKEEYPESFDCISEGHLDEFLRGLYPFLDDHDLNYSNSVYHEGQSFRYSVIRMMPIQVAQQIIHQNPNDIVSKSLIAELKRREKENADTLL